MLITVNNVLETKKKKHPHLAFPVSQSEVPPSDFYKLESEIISTPEIVETEIISVSCIVYVLLFAINFCH